MANETSAISVTRVPRTSRAETVASTSPSSTRLNEFTKISMTTGKSPLPIIQPAKTSTADYYRDGHQGIQEKGLVMRDATTGGKFYISQPKTLEEVDQKVASIRVYGRPSSSPTKDIDLVPPYSKFFLQGVQETSTERSQIVETFGDWYAFFFGQKPSIFNYTGVLINAQNVNWLQDFTYYYDNFLRGTKCVENNARLVLTYGGRQVEGYMLNTSNSTDAHIDMGVQFSFQLLVVDRKVLGLSEDFGVTISASGEYQNTGLTDIKDSSRADISAAFNAAQDVMKTKRAAASAAALTSADSARVAAQYKGQVNIGTNFSGGVIQT